MQIINNESLSEHSTMRLGGRAKFYTEVHSLQDVLDAIDFAKQNKLKFKVIGEGSNILWNDKGYPGLVIRNQIKGFKIDQNNILTVGAGVVWDSVVAATTANGLWGLELLSHIPGTSGATPVQNVGAYGAQISDTLISVDVYDPKISDFRTLNNSELGFGYRHSIFNSTKKNMIIVGLKFQLSNVQKQRVEYPRLKTFIDQNKIIIDSPQKVRDAVVSVRTEVLPNWKKESTLGSFFKNPIVSPEQHKVLKQKFPDIVSFASDTNFKLAAGWLVEQCDLKGFYDPKTGMKISDKTSLVLINQDCKSTSNLLKFKIMIVTKVRKKFGVTLVQEPELI